MMMRCAFYEKEITPPIGSGIPGQYEEGRYTTGVLDRLYAKAIVFDDGKQQTAMLVLDACSVMTDFCKKVAERVQMLTGIAPEQLAICANHSHYSIPNGEVLGVEEDTEYMAVLTRLAADCVLLAQQRLRPCRLFYGVGEVCGVSFNRDCVMSTGRIQTNVGPTTPGEILRLFSENDPALPVLYVQDENDKPMGALINFACHQDTVGVVQYSGDYSSELSYCMKARYGHNFVSVYIPGASGDINHLDLRARKENKDYQRPDHRTIGRRIASEAIRVISEECTPVTGMPVKAVTSYVPCLCRRASQEELRHAEAVVKGEISRAGSMLGARQADILLRYEDMMNKTGKVTEDVPVQIFRIGELTIFAMPGEMYHQYGLRLRAGCPGGKSLVATLCNGNYGYIAVPELYGTDVYPVQLCNSSYLEPEAGNKITEKALTLACQLCGNDQT